MTTVTYRANDANLSYILHSRTGAVARDLYRRGLRVEATAKQLVPVDTGRLRSSITTELVTDRGELAVQIGPHVDYARFVHDGTGIYGPRHAPIVAHAGRVMVFTPRGASGPVFTLSSRGTPAHHFMTEALPAFRAA